MDQKVIPVPILSVTSKGFKEGDSIIKLVGFDFEKHIEKFALCEGGTLSNEKYNLIHLSEKLESTLFGTREHCSTALIMTMRVTSRL